MTTEAGRLILHYRIVEKLGAGGMGEVYRAEDTKLGRQVAVKVLPEAVAGDPERLARFEREAKVLASLNHPNIAGIYSLESATAPSQPGDHPAALDEGEAALGNTPAGEGTGRFEAGPATPVHFLVMELVEGEDLKQRLDRGPIPVDEALPLALQIAQALETAHEQGIVHRDLKPANVKVTPEGQVKVLDFGLAKALEPAADLGSGPTLSMSPTLTAQMTQPGVLLGTAAYMSPEQARGQEAGRQADIWAFGCVVFELLSGQPPFAGETVTDLLASVVKTEPEWGRLPPETPSSARRLLLRCLAKDPKRRLHDIADARLEIDEALELSGDEAIAGTPIPAAKRWPLGVAALLALAGAAFGIWGLTRQVGETPQPVRQLEIRLPEEQTLRGRPAVSPDGRLVVYSATTADSRGIFVRDLETRAIVSLDGTEGGAVPSFSPDGRWLTFVADSKLLKVALEGGQPIVLAGRAYPHRASWTPDGEIVFPVEEVNDLHRIAPSGGDSRKAPIDWSTFGEVIYFNRPAPFIDPSSVLVSTFTRDPVPSPAIFNLESGALDVLPVQGIDPQWASSGHLLYRRRGSLMAVPFDPERREPTGSEATILDSVGSYHLSGEGTLVYVHSPDTGERQLARVDRNGDFEPLPIPPGYPSGDFRLSPTGSHLAISLGAAQYEVWIFDLANGRGVRLDIEGNSVLPVWEPDGRHVIFANDGDPAGVRLLRARADGSGEPTRIPHEGGMLMPADLSPDGQYLVAVTPRGHTQIVALEPGAETLEPHTTDSPEWGIRFSPDGRFVVFTSDASGTYEVYVRPFPNLGDARWMVSAGGGEEGIWSPTGDEIVYRNGTQWMSVPVDIDPEFRAGPPAPLLHGDFRNISGVSWEMGRDGQSFLMMRATREAESSGEIRVVLNFFAELQRLTSR